MLKCFIELRGTVELVLIHYRQYLYHYTVTIHIHTIVNINILSGEGLSSSKSELCFILKVK